MQIGTRRTCANTGSCAQTWLTLHLYSLFQISICLVFVLQSQFIAADDILPTPAISVLATRVTPEKPKLSASPIALSETPDSPSVVDQIASRCQTGSLIFSRGDCLAVKTYTCSRFTHVATIVMEENTPWIYESTSGHGVRKVPLKEYLEIDSPHRISLLHPNRAFTTQECTKYQAALDSQIGREYSVTHFVTGTRSEGLHCAEYLTDSLMAIHWLEVKNSAKVSPGSLYDGITKHGVYLEDSELVIARKIEAIPEPETWYGSLWQETKSTCHGGTRQLSRWFFCQ
ncbi:YiiX/YebB-like N1pC/P60 family cysteine hydrolase [Planctomicrobium sp. SH668]|uniref:YiiX/YebB-like N1pC/P60 family cysteine hydrolase n=1 Tax=Planctomicrobium sp. SH668 TaxID=3448126 RepID=UPI003F5C4533